ncbi:hypothetical protein [Ruminococcus sp. Marseille-P6503]|uniref:hypothetical protein n=1 Tax=Ruminococcus sp. Marseille-P6503 TaxID=2364796 RepID=UPI000F54BE04|nr:hypothetical protein [Ruminococcus sp. Marseille-P6503]
MKIIKKAAAFGAAVMMMASMNIGVSAATSEKNFKTYNNYTYTADFVRSEAYGKSYKANCNGTNKIPISDNATYALKATKTTSIARVENLSKKKLSVNLRIGYYDKKKGKFIEQAKSKKYITTGKFEVTRPRACTNETHKYKLEATITYTNDAAPMSGKYMKVTAKQYK